MQIGNEIAPVQEPQASLESRMGTDAFLTLLVVQLRAQNPLEPLNPTEFTAQLAQFNTLEQLIHIRQTLEDIASRQPAPEAAPKLAHPQ